MEPESSQPPAVSPDAGAEAVSRPRESQTSRKMMTAREREVQVFEYRKMGFSYTQIAKKLEISRATAHKAAVRVLKQLKEQSAELAEEARTLDLQRVDAMITGLWKDAVGGNVFAVDRVARLIDLRSRLIPGMAVAQKHEHGGMTNPDGTPSASPIPIVFTDIDARL